MLLISAHNILFHKQFRSHNTFSTHNVFITSAGQPHKRRHRQRPQLADVHLVPVHRAGAVQQRVRLRVARLDLLRGRLAGPQPVAPLHQPRLEQPRPDALQAAGVLRMEGVVAADARVLEHLAVEGEARRRAAGRAAAGQRRRHDDGRAEVDDGAADGSGQRADAGKGISPEGALR